MEGVSNRNVVAIMTYYYGVVYFNNDEASISRPYESLDTLMEDMRRGIEKHRDKVVATSYITRSKPMTTMEILGHPKSRNIIK